MAAALAYRGAVPVSFPHGETVTVLREQRDPATGISTLVEDRALAGCAWAPVGQETNDPAREHVTSRRSLFTPPGSALRTGERVRFVDGTLWEVVVDADTWRSPWTGWTPGDHIMLTKVTPPR